MTSENSSNQSTQPHGPSDGPSCAVASGSAILAGRYETGQGGWFIVRNVMMPGYPNYDGGLTGVSVLWGREKQFIPACDEEHFWSKWPWSLFNRTPVSLNTPVSNAGANTKT